MYADGWTGACWHVNNLSLEEAAFSSHEIFSKAHEWRDKCVGGSLWLFSFEWAARGHTRTHSISVWFAGIKQPNEYGAAVFIEWHRIFPTEPKIFEGSQGKSDNENSDRLMACQRAAGQATGSQRAAGDKIPFNHRSHFWLMLSLSWMVVFLTMLTAKKKKERKRQVAFCTAHRHTLHLLYMLFVVCTDSTTCLVLLWCDVIICTRHAPEAAANIRTYSSLHLYTCATL